MKKSKAVRVAPAAPSYPVVGSNPVPATMLTKMTYEDIKQISAAGVSSQTLYRLCSIFDPDFTGVGHQPMGHDQWATLYGRYRVLGCSYEIHAVNYSDGNPQEFSVSIAETSTPGTAIQEHASTQLAILPNNQQQVKVIKGYVDTTKFEGDPGARYDKDYSAAFGNNPARELFLVLQGRNMLSASDIQIAMIVKLVYYVRMYDRVDLNLS